MKLFYNEENLVPSVGEAAVRFINAASDMTFPTLC